MKHILLSLLIILITTIGGTAQTTYYWSIDKKVPVDYNYQIVSMLYDGNADVKSLSTKLSLKESDVKEVNRIHEKINRIDFANAISPSSLPADLQKQIIPSLTLGQQPIPIS